MSFHSAFAAQKNTSSNGTTVSSPASPAVTPNEAKSALAVLNDPRRLADVKVTISVLAAGNALTPNSPATGIANNQSATLTQAAQALKANGLTRQLSRQILHVFLTAVSNARVSVVALISFRAVNDWWTTYATSPAGKAELASFAWISALTLVLSLFAEWMVWFGLKRARAMLAKHSDSTLSDAPARSPSRTGDPQKGHDQFEHSGLSAAHGLPYLGKLSVDRQLTLLRRLPNAISNTLLNLLPALAFVVFANVVLMLCTADHSPQDLSIGVLIDAYAIFRISAAVSGFFFSPKVSGIRMLPMSDHWAVFLQRWSILMAATIGAGSALVEAAVPFGLTLQTHSTITKLIGLLVHGLAVVLIVKVRQPVANMIRAATGKKPAFKLLGTWFADVWAGLAICTVVALWVAWAMGGQDRSSLVLNILGLSVLVLCFARVLSIVILGLLGRAFNQAAEATSTSIVRRRLYRYYPLFRRITSWLLGLLTLAALLQVWGVDVISFFIQSSVGHRLGSAVLTIGIATSFAMLVWEVANAAAERRIDAWRLSGDLVRVARLNTLLPMLRTALFTAIALAVALTALSEIGINTTPLLASASIFGVAIGFGSQKLVQDFITGIFLLMENAMQIGDWVTISGVSGTVEYLSIRTVRIRALDGSLFTVPFSSVTTVNNANRGIGNASVNVTIAFDADVDCAIETLAQIGKDLRADEKFKAGILADLSFWGVDQIDGAKVTLVGQIQCIDSQRWSVQREFNKRIREAFKAKGIEIANPQRTFVTNLATAPGVQK